LRPSLPKPEHPPWPRTRPPKRTGHKNGSPDSPRSRSSPATSSPAQPTLSGLELQRQTTPTSGRGISLDLTEATLLHFPAAGIRVKSAHFKRTRFIGGANFAHADFEQHVYFPGATFEGGPGHFFGAWFGHRAIFVNADFGEHEANFRGATFAGMVFLADATFGGGITLDHARALTDFDTNWGSERQWPAGWIERPLADDEHMPAPDGRWANAPDLPAGDPTWNLVVRDNDPDEAPGEPTQ
jgi:hypothetical protein